MLKGYRSFIFIFFSLLVIYVIAEVNRPEPINWDVTLSKEDKNPYGSYVLYNELNQLFPKASLKSYREPAYDLLRKYPGTGNIYVIIAPTFDIGEADKNALLAFVKRGNTVLLSTYETSKKFADTLGFKTARFFNFANNDSTSINFVNPSLKQKQNYRFKKFTVDEYFKEIKKPDLTTILGVNQNNNANFIKLQYGKGAIYIHAAPLCFSNYFMLFNNNSDYLSKMFSYLPANAPNIFWDEYYKLGRDEPTTPLRFLLSNTYLTWALRITIILLVLYVLFDMKRRQRIIPVIEPLRNNSLDFVKTVSSVYFTQHDNKSIAQKKMQYWFEYVRQRYYLSMQNNEDEYMQQLHRKAGVPLETIVKIFVFNKAIQNKNVLNDAELLEMSTTIDAFYKLCEL